jgi:parallel beta helix pectate lyase-like protein
MVIDMKLLILILITFFVPLVYGLDIVDNFSKGDWKKNRATPGKLTIRKNQLFMVDKVDEQPWVTAYKTFKVDIDKTPLLVVKVLHVSDRGQVKLVRKTPYAKKPVLSIHKRGIYTVNLKEQCRWAGKNDIEVMLYAIGEGAKATYSYVKFTDKLNKQELAEIEAAKQPPKNRPKFELVPLFNSCSYYFINPEKKAVNAFYREKDRTWKKVVAPVWISEEKMYRGSIVGLDEATDYEFKITSGDSVLGTKSFKTWNSEIPIAKTIVLNEKNFKGYLKINIHGSPKGWIKYTAAPGFVLKSSGGKPLIDLIEAKYILLEGLTLQGGGSSAVYVKNCQNIRFINCDISGWGRVGTQRFDKDGKYYTDKGRSINNDAGIYLFKSKNTVVERCYFHDPRNTANAWRYSHPAGPEGMMIYKPESTVVRYNDFIGSDKHRWNDAIEGAGNFHKDGGFNRDADIYGNMIIFANDDCVEIDGGQQNVRVFMNKFEGALCAVSIQGCMAGPSYVYRNLMVNMGDEFGAAGQIIKTSSYYAGKDAVAFIFNNTVAGNGKSLPLHRMFKIVAKNNIFAGKAGVGGRSVSKKAETDYNLVTAGKLGDEPHGIFGVYPKFEDEKAGLYKPLKTCPSVGKGVAIDNFTEVGYPVSIGAIPQYTDNFILPYRPIPVALDKYQLNFAVEKGRSSGKQIVIAKVGGKDFSADYRIRQNNVFNWFSVTPASGKLVSGKKTIFTVKLNPDMMKERINYRGLFLIRLKNGYSRPVTIYAKTDMKTPLKIKQPGFFTTYFEAETPTAGEPYKIIEDDNASGGKCVHVRGKRNMPAEYVFDIPKDGKYSILMRVKSDAPVGGHDSLLFKVDNEKMNAAHLRSATAWTWALAANSKSRLTQLKIYKLKKGKHTISIMPRESIYLDTIVITDNLKIFEIR